MLSIGTRVWSIFWVQIFAAITNLLLVLSESICLAIHCKHHSWSTCTTGFFSTLGSSFTITRRTIHGFTTSIHGSAMSILGSTTSIGLQHFLTILQGVYAGNKGSTTSTTIHASLQTLGFSTLNTLTFINLWIGATESTIFFRISAISHQKGISISSNGFFA